jgi:hypothetical protein
MIIKTVLDKGAGYDRPFDYDEITIDLKVYQELPFSESELQEWL